MPNIDDFALSDSGCQYSTSNQPRIWFFGTPNNLLRTFVVRSIDFAKIGFKHVQLDFNAISGGKSVLLCVIAGKMSKMALEV